MKVKISYTVDAHTDFRKALAHRHGRSDLATREEIQSWYESNGSNCDADLMDEYERRTPTPGGEKTL